MIEDENGYTNHYYHCGVEWTDDWSCMCDDRCPVCTAEIEPFYSVDNSDQTEIIHAQDVLVHRHLLNVYRGKPGIVLRRQAGSRAGAVGWFHVVDKVSEALDSDPDACLCCSRDAGRWSENLPCGRQRKSDVLSPERAVPAPGTLESQLRRWWP